MNRGKKPGNMLKENDNYHLNIWGFNQNKRCFIVAKYLARRFGDFGS
jgi:hypothetical protein